MFKHFAATVFVFVAILLTSPTANAATMSEALARMDSIIKEMQALRAEFASLASSVGVTSTPVPAVQGSTSGKTLTMDLSYGATNEDIARIQRLLATDSEIYPYGVDSGFFGPKTQEAIRNFQTRFGLDPVGVVGPSTTALLEVFFAAYPDENYPANVLANKPNPTVQGASTSVTTPSTPTYSTSANPADEINVEFDGDEALIEIVYTNGNRKGLVADTDDENEVVRFIASKTVLTEAQINQVIDFDGRSSRGGDHDRHDASDALDAAEEAIDDAEQEIEDADDDGDDVDWAEETLEEAEDALSEAEEAYDDGDYDEAVELAEEAEDLAKDAEDRIDEEKDSDKKGDSDEIDEIIAEVKDEDDTEVTVEYEDGDDYQFDVEEDRIEKIIAEIADELDISENDVEDLIEFDFGDIDSIEAIYEEGRVRVEIEFESGVTMRILLDEDEDEDNVIEEVADAINADEDDVEDVIDFVYDN